MCIDIVEFEINTTCIQDEFIAHRLGLIPLQSSVDLKQFAWNHVREQTCKNFSHAPQIFAFRCAIARAIVPSAQ
jgi:DNA-directed RNA polymerase alpha subunit